MREFPSTSNVSYSNTVSSGGDWLAGVGAAAQAVLPNANLLQFAPQRHAHVTATTSTTNTTEHQMATRILRVILADPDDNLPVEKRVLFQGPEKLTDLTDQELFFELPVQDLLAKHNELRSFTKDKDQSANFGRDVMLEPIKIRDLKMVIVNVANLG